MQALVERIVLALFDVGAIVFGKFRFKHHEKHPRAPRATMKINLRIPDHPQGGKLTPKIVNLIAFMFLDLIEQHNLEFDYIAGIPRAGEPFAEIVAKILNKPLLRLEKKDLGGGKRKIGRIISSCPVTPGKSVLILDDVITRGESKGEATGRFKRAGLKIAAIMVAADREEGGMEIYTDLGYRMIAGFTGTRLMEIGLANGKTVRREFQKHQNYLVRAKKFFASAEK